MVETQNRSIKTAIPSPGTEDILDTLERYESRSMQGQIPIVWDRAEDFNIYDKHGNKWIDFTSTIFVANIGHGNQNVRNAVKEVLEKPLFHTYAYVNEKRVRYHKKLIEFAGPPFEKAFLLSAGTEATEAALKLMRMNGKKIGKRRLGIIGIEGNWHGRTMGAQMMSGNASQKDWIGYHDPNIFHIPFPYPWDKKANANPKDFFHDSIKQLVEKHSLKPLADLSGFMIESFQGWGSVFYPKEYLKALEEYAYENEMLVCFDEMQAGFGRTGKLFGYMHYDVEPDLICCGKGVSSGLPLALVLGPSQIMDLPPIGSMSSTHSANPLACVASHSNLQEILEGGLIENSETLGEIFHRSLNYLKKKYPDVLKDVFGKGLLAGLIFRDGDSQPLVELCNVICEKAMQKGLLVVHTGREAIKLAPPLTINEEALVEGTEVLDLCINEALEEKF